MMRPEPSLPRRKSTLLILREPATEATGRGVAAVLAAAAVVVAPTRELPPAPSVTTMVFPWSLVSYATRLSTFSTTRVLLEGLATSDLDLARVVGTLSGQKAFANVKLGRSKPVTGGGVTRYAFELTIDVPPAASAQAAARTSGKGPNG